MKMKGVDLCLVILFGLMFVHCSIQGVADAAEGSQVSTAETEIILSAEEKETLEAMRSQADSIILDVLGQERGQNLLSSSQEVELTDIEMDQLKTRLVQLLKDEFGAGYRNYIIEGELAGEMEKLEDKSFVSADATVQFSAAEPIEIVYMDSWTGVYTRFYIPKAHTTFLGGVAINTGDGLWKWDVYGFWMKRVAKYVVLPWVTWNWADTQFLYAWHSPYYLEYADGQRPADKIRARISDSQGVVDRTRYNAKSVTASGNAKYGFFPSIRSCTTTHELKHLINDPSYGGITLNLDKKISLSWKR
ncbi:MAG: hypothetical protein JW822_07050 [Spirochaetales bacterium]|nr:hypothetical protein [Spirochaetales bacterium]